MQKQPSPTNKLFLTLIVMSGWFALVTQLYINITAKAGSLAETITRFFSYFTILTNLLVAIACTALLLKPGSKWGRFFSGQQAFTAITVYIVIVGLIYNTILRFTWDPQGMQRVVDEMLHSVIPVLVLLYWLIFVRKNELQWKHIFPWQVFPFAYIIFVLVRGAVSGFYPYPFINAYSLGINKVVANSVGIALLFIIASIFFVGLGKFLNNKI